jgi:hypothetical protein
MSRPFEIGDLVVSKKLGIGTVKCEAIEIMPCADSAIENIEGQNDYKA